MSEFDLGNVELRLTREYRGYTLVLLPEHGIAIERGGHRIDEQPTLTQAEATIDEWMNAP